MEWKSTGGILQAAFHASPHRLSTDGWLYLQRNTRVQVLLIHPSRSNDLKGKR